MNKPIDIHKILGQLSLEDKIGQLQQLATPFYIAKTQGEITGPLQDMGISEADIWRSGSVLGINDAEEAIEIQNKYLEKSTHKIPLLFMADIIHGYRTIFPVPLAIGCSWNSENAVKCAKISGKEAALSGVHLTFSPMVDLVRDPRWGRVMESTGEDPYLNSIFAKAFVKGYQGNLKEKYDIAACVKHFAAYGAAEAGRDYNTVDLSDRQLREYYLPAYKAAIDEGVKMVMTSFNTVHGVPASANKYLMRDILRDEWQFEGVVISDWGAVGEMLMHGVAGESEEVAQKAIEASVDIEMMTAHYIKSLKKLVQEGIVSESLIDEAVLRILQLKKDLGLFENPYKVANIEEARKVFLCEEHRKAARKVATESMVLLKNENTLPFNTNQKVAIIGPMGESGDLLGPWSWQGKMEEVVTLKQGVASHVGENNVIIEKGCEVNSLDTSRFNDAVEVAKQAEVIILALGESSDMSGEAGSRANIGLPGVQEKLAYEILKLNKPTVVILFNGRPLDITQLSKQATAILEAWYPGTEAGHAVADILYGKVNPSGRLAMSFPYAVGQVPVYYNCYNTGRPKGAEDNKERYVSHFIDIPNEPLYPFGYGLSYTTFEYSDFKLDKKFMTSEEVITATIKVKNTGNMLGKETVQLYIHDLVGSVVRPVKELKGYQQILLHPNEEVIVQFEITEEMLKYHNIQSKFVAEKGEFEVMVGPNSKEVQLLKFELI